jgi:autotransporter translocation and assembly factor TamB
MPLKKIFVIIAVFFIVLLIGAEVYVRSDAFALRIRPHVIGPLTQVLGSKAQIGRIRANLIPPSIEARDIGLFDNEGRPAAALRNVKVYINPLPLLLKKIRLPSIVLLEPRIYAERTKEGEISIAPLIDRIRANISRLQSSNSSGYSVLLRTITVSQGSLLFKDNMTRAQVSVSRLQAATRVNLAGDIVIVTVRNSNVRVAAPSYSEVTGGIRGAARYAQGKLHLETLDLSTADTSVSVSGTIGSFPDPELDIRVRARSGPQTIGKLTRILDFFKKERRFLVEATAAVKGTISNPSLDGVLHLAGISYQGFQLHNTTLNIDYRNKQLIINGGNWKISRESKSMVVDSINAAFGHGPRGLDIQRLEVLAGDLSLTMAGRADPQRGFDSVLAAESRGKGQTLTFLTSVPVEGSISVKGYLTGPLNAPLFDGGLSGDSVIIRGINFDNAEGRIQYRDKTVSLVSVDIHQKTARYFFNGSVDIGRKDPVFAARLKVIRSDVRSIVSLFYKPLPLHFIATGELLFNGTAHDFFGSGGVSVEAGSAYGESFRKGTITATLTKDKISFPSVTVDKGSGTVAGSGWIGFDGTYSAAIESSGVRLEEVNLVAGYPVQGVFDLAIASMGSFSRPQVTASLKMEDLVLHEASLGGMNADLQIADGELAVTAGLDDERAGITARLGLKAPHGWTVQASVNDDGLDPFWLFGKKDLQGRVRVTTKGKVSIRGKGRDVSALYGTALFDPLQLVIGDYRIDNTGAAGLSLHGDRVTITSLQFSGQGTKIAATGSARFNKNIDVSLAGTGNLSLLRPLFKDLEHTDGTAEVELSITDDWDNPEIAGELAVKNGEVKLKDVPQKFYALNGKISFDRSRIIVETLTGEIGGGTLSASGRAGHSGLKLQDFSSRIAFENVTLRYPEGLVSTLSGELHYDGNVSAQALTGDIQIRRARYDKRIEWKSMLVDIGKGLYQKKKTESGWIGDTEINVRFYGKDNIFFENNLAKMPLEVDVFLRGTANRPQLLGRIDAPKGSVYFRQNEFKILHAAVDFVDPNRVNPVLDIQAEIQVREYLVRLAVSGTADQAVVALLSDPPLIDSDILTLLALGKTGSELKGREAGVGMSEAASFATGQFQDMFESRARSLTGLDRFQVDPYVSKGDTSVPRVTVGKELVQGKLYVMYSSNVGSTTPEQIFRIEYILNKHFSVVGERNELGNTGADIKYRFEFK